MNIIEFEFELANLHLDPEIIEFNEITEDYDFIIEFDFYDIMLKERKQFDYFRETLKKEASFNENWFMIDKPSNYPKISMRYNKGFYFESNIPNYTPEDDEIVNLYYYCVGRLEYFFSRKLKEWGIAK